MLPAVVVLGLLGVAYADVKRDDLLDNLGYGVDLAFEVRMTVEEFKAPEDTWLEDLIAGFAGDESHPVAHLARARAALDEKKASEFREAIEAAGRGLYELGEAQGEAFPTDLRFLLGYCYALVYWNGGPASALERAEKVFLPVVERNPSYWRAAETMARVHFSAYVREQQNVDSAAEHLGKGVALVERALDSSPDVYRLHYLRASLRQHRLFLLGFDPMNGEDCERLLDVLQDWRESAQYFEEPAVVRACIAVTPAGFLIAQRKESASGEGSPELEALAPQIVADLEGALPFDVFAGRASALLWWLRFSGRTEREAEQEAFASALQHYAEPQVLHAMRILEALERDDCGLAEAAADAALKSVDDDNLTLLAAHTRLACGDGETAEALVRARLAEQPSKALSAGLGTVLLHLGKDEEALRELRAALEADPDSVRARFGLGTALALQGDLEGALEHLKQARESEPSSRLLKQIEASIGIVSTALAEEKEAGG